MITTSAGALAIQPTGNSVQFGLANAAFTLTRPTAVAAGSSTYIAGQAGASNGAGGDLELNAGVGNGAGAAGNINIGNTSASTVTIGNGSSSTVLASSTVSVSNAFSVTGATVSVIFDTCFGFLLISCC